MHDFMKLFLAEQENHRLTEIEWVAKMRSEGIKAAHPDDGWVNRKEHKFTFCYPQFNDGIEVGCKVALGDQYKHRVVLVTGKEETCFRDLVYWKYKPAN